MKFLEELKNEFTQTKHNSSEIKALKSRLETFLDTEIKSYYAESLKDKLKKIHFFVAVVPFMWGDNSCTKQVSEEEKEKQYREAVDKMFDLINDIMDNYDEYKKLPTHAVSGDYVMGDKVSGDKAGRDLYKSGGDMVFGNQNILNKKLDELKDKINQEPIDGNLKSELLGIVEEIKDNQSNKDKKKELANKLWERGAQIMTILGPFAPLIFR